MQKIFWKTMMFSALTISLFSCNKSVEEGSNLAPGQGELNCNITLGTSSLSFKASGMYSQALKMSAFGTTNIAISGSIPSGTFAAMSIQFTDITKTGTYTDGSSIVIMGTIDGNSASDKSFFSDDKVTLTISKITDTEVEGTFSCDITNLDGTVSGKITGGSFRGRFQ
ncbi:MAG: hypothetical protein MUE99_09040 [Chitinophagaceae bacterium]|jgi:hypothetical protein|nr:hypothetical protein [Chitinophagaceae bacterium]